MLLLVLEFISFPKLLWYFGGTGWLIQARSQGMRLGRWEDSPCLTQIRSICPKQRYYALNSRPEDFFVSSFSYKQRVPHHNFWFSKMPYLVAQAFKQLIQRRRLTTKSWYHLSIGLIWRHFHSRISNSRTPCHTSEHVPLQKSSQ